ncbi:GUN4 domain-containing protein [Phormidesmis sp. 146-33]
MSEESSSAKTSSESKSPNRSEQVADIILKAIVAGGGANALWSFFRESDLPKAMISAAFALGAGYVVKLMQPVHKRAEEGLDQMGNAAVRKSESVFSQASGFEKKYLEALKAYCDKLKIEGVKGYLKPLPLEKVFVPVRLNSDPTKAFQVDRIKSIWDLLPNVDRLESQVCRLAIVADPGYGKTTLTRFLTLNYANTSYREHRAQRLIPVLLLLRSIYTQIQDERSPTLPDLITDQVRRLPLCEELRTSSQWFKEQLQQGKCLIMLDGLDEVPDGQREKVSRWANWQMQNYPTPLILTSRPHGYDSTLFDGMRQVGIRDFNREQKSDFIHKWYHAREEDYWQPALERSQTQVESKRLDRHQVEAQTESDAQESAIALINQLAQNPALNELANNPLLVTIIAITHQVSIALPTRRVTLYQEIFKTLLEIRPNRRETQLTLKSAEDNQAVLQILAVNLTQQNVTQFTPTQAAQWIQVKLSELGPDGTLTTKKFLQEIQDIAGLLAGGESNLYQFTHKTFQEYLAAVELSQQNQEAVLIEQFHNPDWKEVICFYAALQGATKFVQVALESRTEYGLILARRMIVVENSKADAALRNQLSEALAKANLTDELRAKVRLEERFRRLIVIDDKTQIDPNYITCGEYQLFLTAQTTGQFHSQAMILQLPMWQSDAVNQPVTGISWQDARWFCAWSSTYAPLRSSDTVYDYRLPTVEELQRAPDHNNLISHTNSLDRPGNALRVVRTVIPERYRSLQNYLSNGRWEEADQETFDVMLEVAKQKEKGYLNKEDIRRFPCNDIYIIDQLWVKFSGGRFGFSVQKQIYIETGNTPDGQYHKGSWEKFCNQVGWMQNQEYVEATPDTSALEAHLPAGGRVVWVSGGVKMGIFSRIEACDL